MQSRGNLDLFIKLSRSPREFPLHTTLRRRPPGYPSLAAFAICCLPKENPGLMARGKVFQGELGGLLPRWV